MNSPPWREPRFCCLWPVKPAMSTLLPPANSNPWSQVKRAKPWSKHASTRQTRHRALTPPWTSAWVPRALRRLTSPTRCLSRRAWATQRWEWKKWKGLLLLTGQPGGQDKNWEYTHTTSLGKIEVRPQLWIPKTESTHSCASPHSPYPLLSSTVVLKLKSLWLTECLLSNADLNCSENLKKQKTKKLIKHPRVTNGFSGKSLQKRIDKHTRRANKSNPQAVVENNLCRIVNTVLNFCLLSVRPLLGVLSTKSFFN